MASLYGGGNMSAVTSTYGNVENPPASPSGSAVYIGRSKSISALGKFRLLVDCNNNEVVPDLARKPDDVVDDGWLFG